MTKTSSSILYPESQWNRTTNHAWLLRLGEKVFSKLLEGVSIGSLKLGFLDGTIHSFGQSGSEPAAVMQLHHPRAGLRICLGGDVGLAESYMDGDWSTPNLVKVLELGPRNYEEIEQKLLGWYPLRILNLLKHLKRPNSKRGSRRNIADHYDLGNDFYQLWLDPGMTYSSAWFESGKETLQQAQCNKYQKIAEKLRLHAGQRVLEIGCGWGGFAEFATREYGCHVTGVTLSREQHDYAKTRIQNAGLQDHVELRLQDYRELSGSFDRIVSIEMLEAVGERHWKTYFTQLRNLLNPAGEAVIQTILVNDQRYECYRKSGDFIKLYVFPGGMLPCDRILQQVINRTGLQQIEWETFGESYATTLALWNRTFQEQWSTIQRLGFDQRFKRLWEYYLAYCEVGFRTQAIDVAFYHLKPR